VDTDRKFSEYALFSPPEPLASRPPWEWSVKEARKHYEWFVSGIPERLDQLRSVVSSSDPMAAKLLDLTPGSLRPLGQWMERTVEIRPGEARSGDSPVGFPEGLPVGLSDVFTTESLSLCIDCGIYLGEVLCARFARVRWVLCEEPRGDVSFHEPVLRGFGRRSLDPVRETVGTVRAMAHGERGPDGLERVYLRWARRVTH
jgi:hypothetical protein